MQSESYHTDQGLDGAAGGGTFDNHSLHTTTQTIDLEEEEPSQRSCCVQWLWSAWQCFSSTYIASVCAFLVLLGCPLAAIGSQQDIDWAMYAGIVMIALAFSMALVAPDYKLFFREMFGIPFSSCKCLRNSQVKASLNLTV